MLKLLSSKISNYRKSGFYLILLLLLAFAGFWKSYFSKMLLEEEKFSFYIHFHAVVMLIWVLMLILQPILIYYKKNQWHRRLGAYSYVHIIVLMYAAVLLVHSGALTETPENLPTSLFISFKDLVVIGFAYGMAIYYSKNRLLHARYMICTSFAFIEPALARIAPYPVVGIVIISIIVLLMIRDRKYKPGRNVFIPFLLMYLFFQWFLLSGASFGFWNKFAAWFVTLPIS